MSVEFHLLTRERPRADGLATALREATAEHAPPVVDGDFSDPNGYLNISGPGLWIEIEPPGHIEAADLAGSYADGTDLPVPDSEQCLWLTVANVPAAAPGGSAEAAWRLLQDLALRYDGKAIDPSE